MLWENVLPGGLAGQRPAFEIHRLKGRLVLLDGREKMVQGVREIFEIFDNPVVALSASSAGEGQVAGKMVLIGRHLDSYDFERSLLDIIGGADLSQPAI